MDESVLIRPHVDIAAISSVNQSFSRDGHHIGGAQDDAATLIGG